MEDIKYRLNQKAKRFKSLFSTPEGREVLKDLEDEFNGDNIISEKSNITHYNLGRRDVVVYIHQLMRHREDT